MMASVWLDERLCRKGDLPDVCLKCGQHTTNRVKKTFTWVPPWVYATIVAGLLVYVIVDVIVRKRVPARVPLCDAHKGHWMYRTLLVVLGLLGVIGFIILMAMLGSSLPPNSPLTAVVPVGILGAVLVWLIAVIVAQVTAIRPEEIHDRRGLKIKGVCEEFVRAYEEECARDRGVDREALERWSDRDERRGSRSRGETDRYRGEEEEEDRPRRRPSRRDRDDDDY